MLTAKGGPASVSSIRWLRWWAIVGVVAFVLGLYVRPAPYRGISGPVYPRVQAPAPDLRSTLSQLGVGSATWFVAAIALPFLVLVGRRVHAGRGLERAIVQSIVAVIALCLISSVAQYVTTYAGAPVAPGLSSYVLLAVRQNLLPFVGLVGIVATTEARRRARDAAFAAERLKREMAEQRLVALTRQLHPHFLFNTLQGISTLIHRDAKAADEMLSGLSDLLRDVLRHRDIVMISLADELHHVRTYLEIAKVRFADRLHVEIDASPALDRASVPLFLLQPLVENSLTHGIARCADGGRICVCARREGDRLALEVYDTGSFTNELPRAADGIGLENTRERLRTLFGDAQSLTLGGVASGGTVARITIPYSELPDGAEAHADQRH